MTAWLAELAGIRVLSGRYRLAPEHPFPAQQEDADAANFEAVRLAREGGDKGEIRLGLVGDSAGACVALWGLRGSPLELWMSVKGIVLLYGAYGLTDSPSISRFGTAAIGMDTETLHIM